MARPGRTMTPISIADRELAKRLTAGLFKKHRPKGEKPGPGFAIRASLQMLNKIEAGEAVVVPMTEYEAVKNAVLRRQATTEVMEQLATTAAVASILATQNVAEDDAKNQAAGLDQDHVDGLAKMFLADALRQVAAAVIEKEAGADKTDQPHLLKLARTLLDDAQIVSTIFQTGEKTGAPQQAAA